MYKDLEAAAAARAFCARTSRRMPHNPYGITVYLNLYPNPDF